MFSWADFALHNLRGVIQLEYNVSDFYLCHYRCLSLFLYTLFYTLPPESALYE